MWLKYMLAPKYVHMQENFPCKEHKKFGMDTNFNSFSISIMSSFTKFPLVPSVPNIQCQNDAHISYRLMFKVISYSSMLWPRRVWVFSFFHDVKTAISPHDQPLSVFHHHAYYSFQVFWQKCNFSWLLVCVCETCSFTLMEDYKSNVFHVFRVCALTL
jgi:hypothetical protein